MGLFIFIVVPIVILVIIEKIQMIIAEITVSAQRKQFYEALRKDMQEQESEK